MPISQMFDYTEDQAIVGWGLGVKIVRDSGAGAHPRRARLTTSRNRGSRRANQRACCVSTSHNHSMLAILDIGGVLALEFALSFSYRTSS